MSAPPGASSSSAARVSRAIRRTPGRSATAGSTSRGRAEVDDGERLRRRYVERPGRSASTRTPAAPVQETSTSTGPAKAASSLSGIARASYCAARRIACSGVRLATTIEAAPARDAVAHRQAGHRAGTDHEHVLAGEVADVLGRAGQRGGDDARSHPVDVGLGVRALADAQGLLEQHVERGADGAGLLADAQRLAGLAQDLALAEHHRVQPGGDVEQVRDRAVVVVHVEVRQHLVGRLAGALADHPRDRLDAAVEAVDVGVDLGAVAGGEHRRLGDVLALGDLADQLLHALGVEGDPLQDRDGGRVVGDAHDQDAHGVPGE